MWSLWVPALPLSLSCDLVGVGPPPKSPSVPRGSWGQHPYQAAEHVGLPPSFLLFQDLDEMDADLLGLKKSNLASNKRPAKGSGKEEPPSPLKTAGVLTANEKGE